MVYKSTAQKQLELDKAHIQRNLRRLPVIAM